MRITDSLKQRDTGFSFEFFPPRTNRGREKLIETVKVLKTYNPLYFSMTCGARGSSQDKTKDAVYILLDEKGVEVIPHITCIGANQDLIKSLLDQYRQRGVENIMALRGDLPEDDPGSLRKDFSFAGDLVKFIKGYGHFCIGVAVYPEGHIEAASLEADLDYTRQKIDQGAEFAVSQMFFDNTYYYSLLERLKDKGIDVPVLPGILPMTDLAKMQDFASICGVKIPRDIEEALGRFKHKPQDMQKQGIELTIKQCRDLKKAGIKYLHFFTLNKPRVLKAILDAI